MVGDVGGEGQGGINLLSTGCCEQMGTILCSGVSVSLIYKGEDTKKDKAIDGKEVSIHAVWQRGDIWHFVEETMTLFCLRLDKIKEWSCFASSSYGLRVVCLKPFVSSSIIQTSCDGRQLPHMRGHSFFFLQLIKPLHV